MTDIQVHLTGHGTRLATHGPSSVAIETRVPTELGGPGGTFSCTDLVATGLATCIATSVQALASREGVADSEIAVRVSKRLSERPRRIAALSVQITIERALTDRQREKILRVARTCPVHRSLSPDVDVEIELCET